MPGKAARDKGARIEREIVARLVGAGITDACKIPLSGSCKGFKDDIEAASLRFEVKARGKGQGFKMLLRWLGERDDTAGLVLRADHHEPLAVLRWPVFELLMRGFFLSFPANRDAKEIDLTE